MIKKDTTPENIFSGVVKITRTWELPPVLKEISGIDYLDSTRIVCIQDEIGSLFVFNLISGVLEAEIPFGPPGDYEAVAIVRDDAYVACADGRLFEIGAFASEKPIVKEYGTHLTTKQNLEGLCYDAKNKMLLVAIKGEEEGNKLYKGIYAFDLLTKKMPVNPIIRIDLLNPVFASVKTKKIQSVIQPSDLSIRPVSGDLVITDAEHNQLMVIKRSGEIKGVYALEKEQFSQPEGITFTPLGDCYLSDEGNKQQPGRLMLVELKSDL